MQIVCQMIYQAVVATKTSEQTGLQLAGREPMHQSCTMNRPDAPEWSAAVPALIPPEKDIITESPTCCCLLDDRDFFADRP
jgi:hypothetical protein